MNTNTSPANSTGPFTEADLAALGNESERRVALRKAWVCWAALLILPVLCLVLVMGVLPMPGELEMNAGAWIFLISSVAALAIIGPGVFILRGHCFRAAWRGRPVEPQSYVHGMTNVWAVLEAGCLLSLAGVVASGALLPCVIPGVMAFMLLAVAGPSGRAMGLGDRR